MDIFYSSYLLFLLTEDGALHVSFSCKFSSCDVILTSPFITDTVGTTCKSVRYMIKTQRIFNNRLATRRYVLLDLGGSLRQADTGKWSVHSITENTSTKSKVRMICVKL